FVEIIPYFYKSYNKHSFSMKAFIIATLFIFSLSVLLYDIYAWLFVILLTSVDFVFVHKVSDNCLAYNYPITYIIKNRVLLNMTILSSVLLTVGLFFILF
ncbi:MAG: hypothetical protein RR770_00660, partial [Bacteroidales bacterium]